MIACRLRLSTTLPEELPDGVSRCLLLTDGLANVGLTDAPVLAAFAADLRASGIRGPEASPLQLGQSPALT